MKGPLPWPAIQVDKAVTWVVRISPEMNIHFASL